MLRAEISRPSGPGRGRRRASKTYQGLSGDARMTRGRAWLHGYLMGRPKGRHAQSSPWAQAVGGSGPGPLEEDNNSSCNKKPKWKQLLDAYTQSGGLWEDWGIRSKVKADTRGSDTSVSTDTDEPGSGSGRGLGRSSSRLSQLLGLSPAPQPSEEQMAKKRESVRRALEEGTLGVVRREAGV